MNAQAPLRAPVTEDEAARCRALWAAVVSTAIADAGGRIVGVGAGARHRADLIRARIIEEAQDWLGSEDFAEVVELAGLDADFARVRADAAIERRMRMTSTRGGFATSRRAREAAE